MNNNSIWFTALVGIIATGCTALITFILTRRKSNAEIKKIEAETEGQEIDNAESLIALWKQLVGELRQEVKDLTAEVVGLRTENLLLKAEMKKLEKIIQSKMK